MANRRGDNVEGQSGVLQDIYTTLTPCIVIVLSEYPRGSLLAHEYYALVQTR